jgi:hypothetical protein
MDIVIELEPFDPSTLSVPSHPLPIVLPGHFLSADQSVSFLF